MRQASVKIDHAAWAAMFIALAGLFWNVNTGFSRVHERMDRLQAETNRRFDTVQTEMNQIRTEMNPRFDTMQAENQRQHDAMEAALRIFEGRITRLSEKADIGPEGAEQAALLPRAGGLAAHVSRIRPLS